MMKKGKSWWNFEFLHENSLENQNVNKRFALNVIWGKHQQVIKSGNYLHKVLDVDLCYDAGLIHFDLIKKTVLNKRLNLLSSCPNVNTFIRGLSSSSLFPNVCARQVRASLLGHFHFSFVLRKFDHVTYWQPWSWKHSTK